jgi:hypothetical protein
MGRKGTQRSCARTSKNRRAIKKTKVEKTKETGPLDRNPQISLQASYEKEKCTLKSQ